MSISTGEMFGLAMVVGVMTGVVAALLVPRLVELFRRRVDRYERQVAALECWLAARLTLSRTSKEFVQAFRQLEPQAPGAQPSEGIPRADQARAAWLSAQRRWEKATAGLLVWCDDAHVGASLRHFERPDALAIRAALAKGQAEVTRLFAELDGLDRLAVETVQQFLHERPPWWWLRLSQGVGFVRRITYRWSRP